MTFDEYENSVNDFLRHKLLAMLLNCRQCSMPGKCECKNLKVINDIWEWLETLTAIRRSDKLTLYPSVWEDWPGGKP